LGFARVLPDDPEQPHQFFPVLLAEAQEHFLHAPQLDPPVFPVCLATGIGQLDVDFAFVGLILVSATARFAVANFVASLLRRSSFGCEGWKATSQSSTSYRILEILSKTVAQAVTRHPRRVRPIAGLFMRSGSAMIRVFGFLQAGKELSLSEPRIAIVGGTGLGQAFAKQAGGKEIQIETPYGLPSSPILLTQWEGVDLAFLSRHGPGHVYNPSIVPYRANIFALKKLGITHVLGSGATGSLREEIQPGHLVICDQVIDKTFRRPSTFFDEGIVAHVEFAQPFCKQMRELLIEAGRQVATVVHDKGTYVCMEGPQFSTIAESRMHRGWGGDLIGMTCMPEAKLAREAEMCFALIALPTDYDCWRPHDPSLTAQALLSEIIGNLELATKNAIELLRLALPVLAGRLDEITCCASALELAIWSDKSKVPAGVVGKLEPIIGKYFR
jgi:5'-methylthioadenosine phosphorylase